MPLYEYICQECGWLGEKFIKYKNVDDEYYCEYCSAELKRTVEVPAKGKVK